MRFVAWLAAQGLAHSTMKGYLSGIRQLHLLQYRIEPDFGNMPLLQAVLKGVKRLQAVTVSRPRLPMTSAVLRSLRLAWERSTEAAPYDTRMLWAVACTCCFGFLRSGEATVPTLTGYDPGVHRSITYVAIDSWEGANQGVRDRPFPHTGHHPPRTATCAQWPPSSVISRCGVCSRDRCSLWRNGRPPTRQVLVRDALSLVGINPAPYLGHSFRIGKATSAAVAGREDAVIKILGRWSSSAYLAYVRIPRSDLSGVSRRMAA